MTHELDPSVFEFLIHLLEVSVVLGIAVIVYITKKYSKNINRDIEQRMLNEGYITSTERDSSDQSSTDVGDSRN
jgi:hypothetical protein